MYIGGMVRKIDVLCRVPDPQNCVDCRNEEKSFFCMLCGCSTMMLQNKNIHNYYGTPTCSINRGIYLSPKVNANNSVQYYYKCTAN